MTSSYFVWSSGAGFKNFKLLPAVAGRALRILMHTRLSTWRWNKPSKTMLSLFSHSSDTWKGCMFPPKIGPRFWSVKPLKHLESTLSHRLRNFIGSWTEAIGGFWEQGSWYRLHNEFIGQWSFSEVHMEVCWAAGCGQSALGEICPVTYLLYAIYSPLFFAADTRYLEMLCRQAKVSRSGFCGSFSAKSSPICVTHHTPFFLFFFLSSFFCILNHSSNIDHV